MCGDVLPRSLMLVGVLVLVARPIAVYVSTIGSGLRRPDRLFLMCMAPRGIVAAAVAAVFSLELAEERGTEVTEMVPIVFTVIVATVVLYGSTAVYAARRLRVARAQPRGVGLVGGQKWVLDLAGHLADLEVPVLVITADRREARLARRSGLLVFEGRVDSEDLVTAVEAVGLQTALILSTNSELNAVALEELAGLLGRGNVYELRDEEAEVEVGVVGSVFARPAFRGVLTHQSVDKALRSGGQIRAIPGEECAEQHSILITIEDVHRIANPAPDPARNHAGSHAIVLEAPVPSDAS